MASDRLSRQLAFVLELDRLKGVLRRTRLADRSRYENSAEHSWHIATMVSVLAEYAARPVDSSRVVAMLLVHDVVEIEAGDTFCYDEAGNLDKEDREQSAAARMFGLLPADQGAELRALWEEFETGSSADAAFAVALDRLQPLLLNRAAEGGSWREHRIRRAQVEARMAPVRAAAPGLWPVVVTVLDEAEARGWLGREVDAEPGG